MIQTIKEKIRQRRSQMLVHSFLYYRMDDPIIDDDKWQRWANELAELQSNNPDDCKINFYDKEFKDWNGDTGFKLPLNDPKVIKKAMQIKNLWDQCYNNGKEPIAA
tara:strand:- start:1621 stop:1938 length:318 start_codon:yes stop_codon:yes gene_type:complete